MSFKNLFGFDSPDVDEDLEKKPQPAKDNNPAKPAPAPQDGVPDKADKAPEPKPEPKPAPKAPEKKPEPKSEPEPKPADKKPEPKPEPKPDRGGSGINGTVQLTMDDILFASAIRKKYRDTMLEAYEYIAKEDPDFSQKVYDRIKPDPEVGIFYKFGKNWKTPQEALEITGGDVSGFSPYVFFVDADGKIDEDADAVPDKLVQKALVKYAKELKKLLASYK